MGTELELCEVLQINSLFTAKSRTEVTRGIYIYGWLFQGEKKKENFLFRHLAFYVGKKDKRKPQKTWPEPGWRYLWDLMPRISQLLKQMSVCNLKQCKRTRVGNVI